MSRVIPVIYNVRTNLTMYSLRLLYHSLVYSILTYCNTVWGNCGATLIGSLYNTQKKLVRAISFSGRYDHTAPMFRKFNPLTISQISSYMSALFVHKSLQNESNLFFNIYNGEHHNTRRRNSNSLALPNILATHSRQSIRWMGCKVWNSLPIDLRTLQNYIYIYIYIYIILLSSSISSCCWLTTVSNKYIWIFMIFIFYIFLYVCKLEYK